MKRSLRLLAVIAAPLLLFFVMHVVLADAAAGQDRQVRSQAAGSLRGRPVAPAATPTRLPPVPPFFAPQQALITGSDTAELGTLITLTAKVSPITATIPFTYYWQATGRPDVTYAPYWLPTVTYDTAWDSIGPKTVTVTVSNIAGSAVATHTIMITAAQHPPAAPVPGNWPEPAGPYLVGQPGLVNLAVGPPTVTLPITYSWQMTDFDPVIHPSRAATYDAVRLAWPSPGLKIVTATARNLAGAMILTREIKVWTSLYLPLVSK
jgi:hypothetical protein